MFGVPQFLERNMGSPDKNLAEPFTIYLEQKFIRARSALGKKKLGKKN
jgi:hypothetical protein